MSSGAHSAPTLAERLVQGLRARGETVATCESLTAGLAAATIAEVPGASSVLRGGLITYATELKTVLADVPSELIEQHSVISPEVAGAMAAGARQACGADWGIGLTGVAGPSEQDGHPVGEVYVAIVGPTGHATPQVCRVADAGDCRAQIRAAAVETAFAQLIQLIQLIEN